LSLFLRYMRPTTSRLHDYVCTFKHTANPSLLPYNDTSAHCVHCPNVSNKPIALRRHVCSGGLPPGAGVILCASDL